MFVRNASNQNRNLDAFFCLNNNIRHVGEACLQKKKDAQKSHDGSFKTGNRNNIQLRTQFCLLWKQKWKKWLEELNENSKMCKKQEKKYKLSNKIQINGHLFHFSCGFYELECENSWFLHPKKKGGEGMKTLSGNAWKYFRIENVVNR